MSYHVMQSTRGAGFRPLTAAMRAQSVGTIYDNVLSVYSEEGLEPPSLMSELEDASVAIDEYNENVDEGLYSPASTSEEEGGNKKMLMIAGGVGAVVLIAGIAVVATRK